MEKEDNDQTYRGTAFADTVEKGVTYAATGLVNNLEKWSKPQEGIHDDVLRFGGKVFSHKLTQNVLKIAGAAGEAGGYVGSNAAKFLGVDPRIGGAIGSFAADAALGFGAGKAAKIGKTALQIRKLKKAGAGLEALHAVQIGKNKGFALAYGPKGAVKTQATMRDALTINKKGRKLLGKIEQHVDAQNALSIGKLPDVVKDVQIARKLKGNTKFVSEITEKTTRMKNLISKTADKRGHANLSKYKGGDNLITTPTGEKFKYMWKDGRYSWRSMTSEAKRALTRLTGESADLTTVTNQFKNHFNPKQAKEAAQIYVATQQTVKKKIDNAIKQFNAGKVKKDPSRLSLEHITDVKFFDRIKKDVPGFPGKGANELQNLTILDLPTNMRTGALNKKLDHWQSVIDSVKTGKGLADYNKSIVNFIYEDVGGMVADFKQKDWNNFIDQMIARQGDTAYDILIEMARKRN